MPPPGGGGTAAGPRGVQLAPFRRVITDAPVSYSVYSAFSFYAARRGGELPGTWLSAALGGLGHQLAAIRQTLYRMEASEELVSRMSGRSKFYRLSAYARAEAEAGLAKILGEDEQPWDGAWSLVHFRAGHEEANVRSRLREILRAEGFAPLGPGLFIHPRDRTSRVLRAAEEHGAGAALEVFRARRGEARNRDFVERLWDLPSLARRYRRFLARFQPLARAPRMPAPAEAFLLRFAVVFDYLEVAWNDPELPSSLLPGSWPGLSARRLARRLYLRMLPGALEHGDALMAGLR